MMSSLRNAAKSTQRAYKERHQPKNRKHLGLLEKKKDYKRRANHYAVKKNTIKNMAKLALERNPDEFYFHMINSRLEDGEHHELDEQDQHTPEQLMMMQNQDLKYITLKLTAERNKIQRLKAQLQPLGLDVPSKKHFVFDEDGEKIAVSGKSRRYNRPPDEQLGEMSFPGYDAEDEHFLPRVAKHAAKSYKELEKRLDRERELSIIQRKLQLKIELSKTKEEERPERLQPATETCPPVYRWKNIRKR